MINSAYPNNNIDFKIKFQAPLSPPRWEGIFEAVNENMRCPQTFGNVILGDPNCLKLYVYTPVMQTKPLPVMVYIHGGGFLEGTGASFLYGPDYFMREDVVFVGISYRLNIEGFLCLGIKEAPGNAGLKDQIAALKWIKENIRQFGGDPDNVTVFGESAGAVSTSFLMLSPLAKGLFHKAILQSGATLAPWAMQHQPLETASILVKNLGHDTKDPNEIYKIIANVSYDELIRVRAQTFRSNSITAELLFVPCIEKNIPGIKAIITEHPADIIKSGNYSKVPMIIGFNDNEGIYFTAKDYGTTLVGDFDIEETLQPDLVFHSHEERKEIGKKLLKHYFNSTDKEKIQGMVDLYSDLHFKIPTILESKMYAMTSNMPIYYYLFKYNGLINMPKIISRFYLTGGASHADELFYMFKPHSFPLPHRFLEQKMITRMVKMWTNFAKYG